MNVMLGPAFLFGTGLDEWAVLGAICFLLFGPKRLPEIARTLGRTLEKLRRAADDFREQIAHLDEPEQPPPSAATTCRRPPVGGETPLRKPEPERQAPLPCPPESHDKG